MTDQTTALTTPPTRSDAMVPTAQLSGAMVFAPNTLAELISFAKWLSTSKLIPADLQGRPEDVAIVLMWGLELQVSPMQALALIHVIKGRPTCAAELMEALVWRSGACEYWQIVETNDATCTIETLRKGAKAPVRVTRTMEWAKRNGLVQRNPTYSTNPDSMLLARCRSALARAVYPDVIRGLYLREEALEGAIDDQGTWTVAPSGNGHPDGPTETQKALEASLQGGPYEADPIEQALEAVPAP